MPADETEEPTPLDLLRDALSNFANSEADLPVLVDVAMVVWEQVSFDEDGQVGRRLKYCVPTDNFSISSGLGLMEAGNAFMRRDLRLNYEDD